MKLGSTTISDLKLGSSAVAKAYLGSNLVWMPTAGGITDPTDLGAKLIAWIDMTDTSTLWQDVARTTSATVTSDPVRYFDDKSGNGNDFSATGANTPANGIITAGGAVNMNESAMMIHSTAVGFTTGMEVFALLDPVTDASWIILGKNLDSGYAVYIPQDSSGAAISTVAGLTHYINNTIVTGTRNNLYDQIIAAGPGYVNQHFSGIDLTGLTTKALMIGYNGSIRSSGDAKYFIITTALTTTERADLNTWLLAQG